MKNKFGVITRLSTYILQLFFLNPSLTLGQVENLLHPKIQSFTGKLNVFSEILFCNISDQPKLRFKHPSSLVSGQIRAQLRSISALIGPDTKLVNGFLTIFFVLQINFNTNTL